MEASLSLVTFSHTPYNEAWDRGEMQQAVMNEVMTIENIESNWDCDDSTIDFAIDTLEKYLSDSNAMNTTITSALC